MIHLSCSVGCGCHFALLVCWGLLAGIALTGTLWK